MVEDAIGLHAHRLHENADNPREVALVEQWHKEHRFCDRLNQLFSVPRMFCVRRPLGDATERDRIVAETVIQWLGSPVGFSAFCEALATCGLTLVRTDDE